MMNWKATYAPNSVNMPTFARTSEPERRIPRRTSGCLERSSIAMNAASSAIAATPSTSVVAELQPRSGASTTVWTSASMPALSVTAPGTSNERRASCWGMSRGRTRGAAMSRAAAIGTGRTKVQRQPISVSAPPRMRPSENPLAPVAV